MEIKAADVMKLRKMTGAGMMDCKNALIEAEGDFARAQDIIREKGKLVVAKRADRTATEGVVVTKIVGQKAYLLCLACETDFVAQNAEYTASANAMLEVAVKNDAADRDALMASKNDEGHTVEEMVTEKSGQTGEKIELAYYGRIEAPYCAAYVHFNKKLGTILGFNKEIPAEVAHTVTMQATAMAPVSISEADCPADVIEHERKIAVEAMKQDPKNANKPDAILEKIAEGKMRKFFEENTLLNQPVVGEKETIAELAATGGKVIATGGGAVLDPENVRALKQNGTIVFLDRAPENLVATDDRPLASRRSALEKLYAERYDIYTAAAELRIDANTTPEAEADAILKELGE